MAEQQGHQCPPAQCLIQDCIKEVLAPAFPGLIVNSRCSKGNVEIECIVESGAVVDGSKGVVGGCEVEYRMRANVYLEFCIENYCEPSNACPRAILDLAATAKTLLLSSKLLRRRFRLGYASFKSTVNQHDKKAFHEEVFTVSWTEKVKLDNGV